MRGKRLVFFSCVLVIFEWEDVNQIIRYGVCVDAFVSIGKFVTALNLGSSSYRGLVNRSDGYKLGAIMTIVFIQVKKEGFFFLSLFWCGT